MIQTHTLNNGLTLMMERLPHLRSTAIGLFVKAGSIMEEEAHNGLSHFIEHMAFKGTTTRSARQIADEIDLIGGNVNAATSKMATSYYARTTDKELPNALTLLADMLVNPSFSAADMEKERQVILEEIAMESDDPQDLVYNLSHQGMFADQTLSRSILGSAGAIKAYSLEDLTRFRQQFYRPGNTVLSVAGRFDPQQLILWAEEAFASWQGDMRAPSPRNQVVPGNNLLTLDKEVEQVHLCLTYEGLPSLDEDRHALTAVSTAFGGGVSSRLFQKVREDQGLVYNIFSAPSFYPDCGELTIYAACTPGKVHKVLDTIRQEAALMAEKGLTRQEFERTMAQLRTGFVLGMESAYQRMASMGMNMLLHQRVIEPRETLALLRKVNLKTANRVARQVLGATPKLALVGKNISKRFKQEGQHGQA